jgi:hypothetical protein
MKMSSEPRCNEAMDCFKRHAAALFVLLFLIAIAGGLIATVTSLWTLGVVGALPPFSRLHRDRRATSVLGCWHEHVPGHA